MTFKRLQAVLGCSGALLGSAFLPAAQAAPGVPGDQVAFRKIVLDREFRSEGVAVADVNRDGKKDIMAGNLWYEAPNWTPHEIAPVQKYDGEHGYSNSFINFAADINGDDWPDQILIGMPGEKAVWRENPQSKPGPWESHQIVSSACNESPAFGDLLGNRKPVLVFPHDEQFMAWYEPQGDPAKVFLCHDLSEAKAPGTQRFSHGLGIGDINGDGRADIITTDGWYEGPVDRRQGPWKFVAAKLGPPSAHMLVYDVNRDGLPDVISSSAHNRGVWWFEQKKGANGPEFEQHTIDPSFSEAHALILADFNGDGVQDIVTGKRFWAHGPTGDEGAGEPAVLYWYELKREAGSVAWTRHEIDADSGVGTQFEVTDMNGDALLDIVVANKKGVFVFLQERRK